MAEVDFPRGGGINVKANKEKKKKAFTSNTKGTNAADKKSSKPNSSKKKITPITFNSNKFKVTPETLHKDVLLLGCVNSVRVSEVIVELPNNIMGVLQGVETQYFTCGQLIAVGVIGTPITHLGSVMVPLTVDPSVVNRNINISQLRAGMFIAGTVSSVEDRGYMVETCIEDTTSFIAKTEATLAKNQPVLCTVTSIDLTTNRVFLTPHYDRDAAFKQIADWKTVSLENVRPGNAAKARVLSQQETGLIVQIYNQPATSPLSAFIPASHLGQPLNFYSPGFRINAKIIYVDYRVPTVLVTTLPHLVNHHPMASLVSDYTQLRGAIFSVPTPSASRPICSLPTTPPVQAIVKTNLTTDTSHESKKGGKTKEVKVVGVSYMTGTLEVSSDPETLENENAVLDVTDLHPGMLINGTVSQVTKSSIEVRVSPLIEAKCSSLHLTDTTTLNNANSVFKEDQQVQCRVLFIDDDDTVHVTNKPTLVNSSLRIITSYHHALPGSVAHGWISKITKTEVQVSFYNNVTGAVPSSDISGTPSSIYRVGEAIVCQVVECKEQKDSKQGFPSFELILTFDIQFSRDVPKPPALSKIRDTFSSINIGENVSGIVSHTDATGLTLILSSGITGILPVQHLSDNLAVCSVLLSRYYIGTQLKDLLVLNKDSSNMRLVLSKKASLMSLPASNAQLQVGQIIPGHIKQISDVSFTVGFLGTNKAVVPRDATTKYTGQYVLGQSVRVVVKDVSNGSLKVDLLDDSTKTNGLDLLCEYFSVMDSVLPRTLTKSCRIGDKVQGKVIAHRRDQVVVLLNNNLIAFVNSTDFPTGRVASNYQQGQHVNGVIIDLDYANATAQMSLSIDENQLVDPNTIELNKELIGSIILAKPTYFVVGVVPASYKVAIVYVPASDYNTQGRMNALLAHIRVGQSVRVFKPELTEKTEKTEKTESEKPILVLSTLKARGVVKGELKEEGEEGKEEEEEEEEEEDEDEEDEEETAGAFNDLMFGEEGDEAYMEDDDGVFQYAAQDSESDEDPDLDNLQDYLKRVAKAKGKQNGSGTNEKSIVGEKKQDNTKASTTTKSNGTKDSKKRETERKNEPGVSSKKAKQEKINEN